MTGRPTLERIEGAGSPVEAFGAIAGEPGAFLLESGRGSARFGRYSILSCAPVGFIESRDGSVTVELDGRREERRENPFVALRRLLGRLATGDRPEVVPFAGGLVGYLSYDLRTSVERVPARDVEGLGLPEMHFEIYTAALVYDRLEGRVHVASLAPAGLPCEAFDLLRAAARDGASIDGGRFEAGEVTSNFARDDYLAAVARAKDYVAAGDIYQVNISQAFRARFDGDPVALLAALRRTNPADFAAFLRFDRFAILSSSPERLIRVIDRHVETRPIKGTRRRTGNPARDAELAAELVASAKDNAELAMIVDLERNDLGRVCTYGSVRVTEPCVLEEHPTVYHLVATVEGDLHEGRDTVDLLRAIFPGGSITGAPKIRSMEIIDELEPTRRGVYTGSIGYIGFDGDLDMNIAIRTIVIDGETLSFHAGGGIVADSEPAAEYEETIDKARALFAAIGREA